MPKRGPRSAEAAERRVLRGVKRRTEAAGSTAPFRDEVAGSSAPRPGARAAGSSAPSGVEVAGSSAPHPGAQVAGSPAPRATDAPGVTVKKEIVEPAIKDEYEPKYPDTRKLTKEEREELRAEI